MRNTAHEANLRRLHETGAQKRDRYAGDGHVQLDTTADEKGAGEEFKKFAAFFDKDEIDRRACYQDRYYVYSYYHDIYFIILLYPRYPVNQRVLHSSGSRRFRSWTTGTIRTKSAKIIIIGRRR
jgi:hypothetical protein